MKFERNIDPRTSMGIGEINNPLTICKAEYVLDYHGNKSAWTELDHHKLATFLGFLDRQKERVNLSQSGWRAGAFVRFDTVNEETEEYQEEVPLNGILGRCVRIEFEDTIYRIPSHIEI